MRGGGNSAGKHNRFHEDAMRLDFSAIKRLNFSGRIPIDTEKPSHLFLEPPILMLEQKFHDAQKELCRDFPPFPTGRLPSAVESSHLPDIFSGSPSPVESTCVRREAALVNCCERDAFPWHRAFH